MTKVARVLLENGADVNQKSLRNVTALHFAAEANSYKVAELLISYKANLYAANNNDVLPIHVRLYLTIEF